MKRAVLQNELAMTVGLVSLSMLFVTLFMGYGIYRTSAPVWPPAGFNPVSLLLPVISTALIALSSWFCFKIKGDVVKENFKSAHTNLNLTLVLGIAFMCSQTMLWSDLRNTGIFVSSGIFASILYGFTWIHAVHVVFGIGALVYLKIVLRPETQMVIQKTLNVEKFWHFLGFIWAIMFLVLFVV